MVSNGSLDVNVKKFSLLYGFLIEDILISNGENFQNSPVFRAKRVSVQYNLPALFTGSLRLTDISLSSPEIYLHKKGGVWNFDALFEPGEKKEKEKKKETPEEPSEPKSELNLYVPVSALLNFYIHDLKLDLKIEDSESPLEVKITDFNFDFAFQTYRFSKIPLSPKAVNIIEVLKIALNPDRDVKLFYKDRGTALNTELSLKLILDWVSGESPGKFASSLHIGNETIPLKFEKEEAPPFGFDIKYNIYYYPEKDSLILNELNVIFSGVEWLDIRGSVERLTSEKPFVNIRIAESKILLDPLGDVVSSLPGVEDMDLRGEISLEGVSAEGDIDLLKARGKIQGKGILALMGGSKHEVPSLNVNIDSLWNLSDTAQSTENDILPILENIHISNFHIIYNGIVVDLQGIIIPKSKVDCELKVSEVNLEKFSSKILGQATVQIHLTGEKLSYLNLDTKAILSKFRYWMGKSISGRNQVELGFRTVIDLAGGFRLEDMQIENLILTLKNENSESAVQMKSKINMEFKDGLLFQIQNLNLDADLTKLIPTLPVVLKSTIAGLRSGLGNNLSLSGKVDYLAPKDNPRLIKLQLGAVLPAIELKDLLIGVELRLLADRAETIHIDKISLSAFENKLKALYKGRFYKPFTPSPPFGDYTGELAGNFTLESETFKYVLKGVHFQGDIDFDLDIKNHMINGFLRSKDSNLHLKSNCPGDDCSETEILGLKMNIPFSHDLSDNTMENLIEGNSESFMQNYGSTKSSNFSIAKVISNHPSIKGQKFDYIKPNNNRPGISGFIEYKENFLTVDNLRIYTLDGMIFGKDIIVNVGNGDASRIQYSAILQVRDIDLKQMLPDSSREKIEDGKIKADLNIKGENLKDPVANVDLFFSVFQIGKDFGRSAVNIVSPTNFVTDRIINSYSVNKIEVEINHGLVYARVLFNKSLINTLLFQVENDRIQQERIPLANFMNRAENELSGYK